jgi:hypothetical protein
MGDITMENQSMNNRLYLELASMEDRGITIWLDGSPSTSLDVSSQLHVAETNSYMRDYVFEEGVLKEVHFDRLNTNK